MGQLRRCAEAGRPAIRATILVVEDDHDIQAALAALLRDAGHTVACAGDGQEALARLRGGFRPDLILLDVMMPVMNGLEFRAAQLRDAALADIPVVVLTADARLDQLARGMRPAAILPKPFELPFLLTSMERALARAGAGRVGGPVPAPAS